MHAVVMHKRGGPDVLRYEEIPTPVPGAGEVLVRVAAATVNRTDLFHRSGRFFIQKPLPHVLGMDVAGVIESVGHGVTGWAPGDRVAATFEALGRERDGAYAEFTTVPTEELRLVPDGLDLVHAATVGLAFTTAWVALVHRAGIALGDRIAVHAASSGVGTAALQIARWAGAAAVAISSPGKEKGLRDLGATAVVDRAAADLAAAVAGAFGGQRATLVLDLVGRDTLRSSVEMLADRGRIACVGTLSGDVAEVDVMEVIMRNATIFGSFGTVSREEHERILSLLDAGAFTPAIDTVLPLADAPAAHERLEAGEVLGKMVLVPESR